MVLVQTQTIEALKDGGYSSHSRRVNFTMPHMLQYASSGIQYNSLYPSGETKGPFKMEIKVLNMDCLEAVNFCSDLCVCRYVCFAEVVDHNFESNTFLLDSLVYFSPEFKFDSTN